MADRDIETVVDGMEADLTRTDLRSHLANPDRGCEASRAPLPCGCDPETGDKCLEHR